MGGFGERRGARRAAVLSRSPECFEAVLAEVSLASGADRRLDEAITGLKSLHTGPADESRARRVAERITLVLQASLLVRYGHPAVADAFCASRLGGDWGSAYGTLPSGLHLAR